MNQNSEHINQDSSLNRDETRRVLNSKPTLKLWSNRRPTVELRCVRPKTDHQAPGNLTENSMTEPYVWGPTHRRAIKEVCKAVNRDWLNHQSCSLSHNIHVVIVVFVTNTCFPQLIRKIISTNNFLNFLLKKGNRNVQEEPQKFEVCRQLKLFLKLPGSLCYWSF